MEAAQLLGKALHSIQVGDHLGQQGGLCNLVEVCVCLYAEADEVAAAYDLWDEWLDEWRRAHEPAPRRLFIGGLREVGVWNDLRKDCLAAAKLAFPPPTEG